MNKTILITGASTGIGEAIAKLFIEKNWNVVATARDISQIKYEEDNVLKLVLDVTKTETIIKAVSNTLNKYGKIDVLVNNAGYGLVGVLESINEKDITAQLDTNVVGIVRCIQAVLPNMRSNRAGTIINITSMGGLVAFPLYSPYHASKWAVEGLSESLMYELAPLGIKVKVVEPGAINTEFYTRGMKHSWSDIEDYKNFEKTGMTYMNKVGAKAAHPSIVAEVVYKATTDNSRRLRYTSGKDAALLTRLHKLVPLSFFSKTMLKTMGLDRYSRTKE
jgi:short-subunit dehydrogenase